MTSTSPKSALPTKPPLPSWFPGRALPLAGSRRRASALACALALTLASASGAQASPFFSKLSAEMTETREAAAAAALPDGDVLIAGGEDGSGFLKTAEVFDPLTATFAPLAGRMISERDLSAAAVLPAGEGVLIVGGATGYGGLKTAEIFNPTSETFEPLAGEMASERYLSAAATLPDGDVLIAGGPTGYVSLKTAELFDPTTKTFAPLAGEMTEPRFGSAAVTLPDGKVLIAGGFGGVGVAKTAELFDPTTDTFEKLAAEMTTERNDPVAAVLPDGKVLIVGSETGGGSGRTTEVFDPATETFESLSAETAEARDEPMAAALPGGGVLIAGGYSPGRRALRSAEEASDLAPAAQMTGGGFGDEIVGETSALQTLVVNSVGPNALTVTGIALSGAQAGAFKIEQDACTGTQLEFRQTCTIGVSFTPPAAGPFSTTLTLTDNEPSPSAVTLSGTGLAAPAGNGSATASGAAAGRDSSPAAQDLAGKVDLITCTTVAKGVKHKRHARMRCTTKLVTGPVPLRTSSRVVKATLSRNGRFLATGTVDTVHGRAEFVSSGAGVPRGACTLTITRKTGKHTTTTYQAITIV
jgi:WD40 repeat protein